MYCLLSLLLGSSAAYDDANAAYDGKAVTNSYDDANAAYDGKAVTNYEPSSLLSYAEPQNYNMQTCSLCTECITSTGSCHPKQCIQEVPMTAQENDAYDGTRECSFRTCPKWTTSAACLQPTKDAEFLIGFVVQALHLLLIAKDAKKTAGNYNTVAVLTGSLLMFDCLGYIIMAGGSGFLIRCCDGRFFYYARTITWLFTTPIMLFILCVITSTSTTDTVLLLLADLLMIVSGGLASTFCSSLRWILFAFSMLCFMPILHFMCTRYQNTSSKVLLKVQKALRWYSLTWVGYAVVWVLSSGTGVICVGLENILYIVLNILSKAMLSAGARSFATKMNQLDSVQNQQVGWFAAPAADTPTPQDAMGQITSLPMVQAGGSIL